MVGGEIDDVSEPGGGVATVSAAVEAEGAVVIDDPFVRNR